MNRLARHAANARAQVLAAAAAACLALPCAAADNASITVSATVLSKSNCRFSSNATLAINLGAIDPSGSTTASGNVGTSFKCGGSAPTASYTVTADDGLYSPGAGLRRLRHATVTTEFMDYSLAISPSAGLANKNQVVNVTVTADVAPAAYGGARSGNYSDTVVLTVSP
ncbi:spore coat protein U domain-containing protein [Ramlibacter humi]|nr:spore coat protein U domain-containing protein [Ramlibacter humi]